MWNANTSSRGTAWAGRPCHGRRLFEQAEPHDRQHRLYAVLPRDLLSLLVAAAVVGDADFEDTDAGADLGDLGGHFGLEAEAVAREGDLVEDRLAEDLVADLHVGQVQVREHVAQRREHAVAP